MNITKKENTDKEDTDKEWKYYGSSKNLIKIRVVHPSTFSTNYVNYVWQYTLSY